MTGEEELANKLKHKAPTSTWESGFNDGIDALLAAVKSRVVLPGNLVTLTVKERDDLMAHAAALEEDLAHAEALLKIANQQVAITYEAQKRAEAQLNANCLQRDALQLRVGRLEKVVEAARRVVAHYMAAHDPYDQIMDENGLLAALADLDATR